MRSVRSWRWRQKPVGLAITRAIPLIAGALLLLCAAGGPSLRPRDAMAGHLVLAKCLDVHVGPGPHRWPSLNGNPDATWSL